MFRHRPLELSAQFTTLMTPAHHWLIGTILADLDNVTTALYRATEKAQQMGIDLNLEKMEQRAKEFNEK
jgi:hypothetical protein